MSEIDTAPAPDGTARAADAPVLRVRDLTVRFGGLVAVSSVNLDVAAGEIVGIIGPNGAGKTTLLNGISGFVGLASGEVCVDGEDVTALLPYQRARRGLGRSFQDARLFPTMTVRETLISAFHEQQRNGLMAEGVGLPDAHREEADIAARALELLALVDLERYLDNLVSELSFGTTRAVELAWLAARRPRVLLLDEPASGLQQSEVRVLGGLIERIRQGAAVVVIDHDVPFVSEISERMVAMDLGEVIAAGTPAEVLRDERVVSSYLGSGRYR